MPSRSDPALDHVLWIGGSACAGKTRIAERLADSRGRAVYHCDDHFAAHRRRADRARHPGFCRIMDLSGEELWMRPVAQQVADLRRFYEDELEMVLEDLAGLAPSPVIAEGVGLLPRSLAGLWRHPRQAVWLVATPEFRRYHYPRRDSRVRQLLAGCRDPQRAYRQWMERDDRIAVLIAEQARRCGGRLIAVDGSRSLDEIVAQVAPWLRLDPPDCRSEQIS